MLVLVSKLFSRLLLLELDAIQTNSLATQDNTDVQFMKIRGKYLLNVKT